MPNPYIVLAALVLAVGLFGSGVSIGYKYRDGTAAKEQLETAIAVVNEARRNVEAESAASLEQQKKLDAQRRAAAEKRHTLEKELLNDEIRKCRVSDATYGLLRDAVWRANHPPVTGGVNGSSAPATDPAKPER